MGLKLNLGCNDRNFPEFLGVDIAPPADVIADLTKLWPWKTSSVEAVLAFDVFEHLPDIRHTMNELWRVLEPGGTALIEVPTVGGVGSFCDPTHLSFWCAGTFEYFQKGNYARERFRNSPYYAVRGDYILGKHEFSDYENPFGETVRKLKIQISAVK